MKIFGFSLDSSKIFFFGSAVFILGLFTSEYIKAIPTIGLSGMLAAILISLGEKKCGVLKGSELLLLAYTGIFFFYLLGFFRIGDKLSSDYWSERVLVKVPFLILPICCFLVKKLTQNMVLRLYSIFFYLVSFCALASTVNYFLYFDEINLLITRSKNLPVVINHVRFSLFVTFSIFLGLFLQSKKKQKYFFNFEAILFRLGALFLVAFLHIAAVRSGLFIFYLLSTLLVIYQLFLKDQKYKRGSLVLLTLILLPFLFYSSSQSLQNKVANMAVDLENINNEERADNYSLSGRWFSFRVGYSVFSDHKYLGVGIANLEAVIESTYAKCFPKIQRAKFKPHNQYLFWLAGSGFVGFSVLLLLFSIPLYNLRNTPLFYLGAIQYILVFLSFLVENTLETQVGANFTILFLVLPLMTNGKRKH